jgi:hypothetical protein
VYQTKKAPKEAKYISGWDVSRPFRVALACRRQTFDPVPGSFFAFTSRGRDWDEENRCDRSSGRGADPGRSDSNCNQEQCALHSGSASNIGRKSWQTIRNALTRAADAQPRRAAIIAVPIAKVPARHLTFSAVADIRNALRPRNSNFANRLERLLDQPKLSRVSVIRY